MLKVMNTLDLRNLIFSYLRKEAKKKCSICECVCIWDKEVKRYIEVDLLSIENSINKKSELFCLECIDKFI